MFLKKIDSIMNLMSFLQPNLMTTEELRNHLKKVRILHLVDKEKIGKIVSNLFNRDFQIKMCPSTGKNS